MRKLPLELFNGIYLNHYFNTKSIILIIMVAVYPLIVVPGPLDFFRGPRYIILAVLSLLSLYVYSKEKPRLNKPVLFPLAIFFLFLLISTLLAEDVSMAMLGSTVRYTGFSTYIYCAFLFLLACQHLKPGQIISPMVACAVIVSVIALLQYFGFNPVPHKYYFHEDIIAYSTMGNTNWVGTYLVFILPVALLVYLYTKKNIWLLATAVIYGGMLVTLTRGVWLPFAVTFLVITYFFFKQKKIGRNFAFLVIMFIVVTLLLLPVNDWRLYKSVFSVPGEVTSAVKLEDDAGSKRMFIWKESIKLIPGNWAFGIGPDHLQIEMPSGSTMDKAHNIYLEIIVTMGIFAFLSYLAFISFFLRRRKNELGFVFFMMVFTYLLQGLFNNDIVQILPLFWIVLGLSLANSNLSSTTTEKDCLLEDKQLEKSVSPVRKKTSILDYVMFTAALLFIIIFSYAYFYPSYGTIEIPGRERYTGQIRGSLYHGEGLLESESGFYKYEGEFKYGRYHGFGKLTFFDGRQYIGKFKEGYKHGEGKMFFPEGEIQVGIWRKNVLVK